MFDFHGFTGGLAGATLWFGAQVLTAAFLVAEPGLCSCGPRASFLHGTQDLPGPATEPASPALAGGFLTTGQPGNPAWVLLRESNLNGWQGPGSGHGRMK